MTNLSRFQAQPKAKKVKPLRDNIIVLPAQKKEFSEGGIALPDTAQRVEISGVVVGVGEEVPTTVDVQNEAGELVKKTSIQVGDRVIFAQHAGTEITVEDDKGAEIVVLIMPYKNAMAKIEEE